MYKRFCLALVLLFSFFILAFLSALAGVVDTAWVRRYDGPAGSTDGASAIAVDGSGNVYVTGQSIGNGTSSDYATIKYYPNGDVAWLIRYNGPAGASDEATAIAVDDTGNIYVTGRSVGNGTSYDFATIKYFPDGDTAWVRRYNGPGNSHDEAHAIAVDATGNVYVTGQSKSSGTSDDYTTVKYGPNGNELWVRSYNGVGNGYDFANDIVVDGFSNVYVTGQSTGDYATIKYVPYQYRNDTLIYTVYSPVDLIVTDPAGDSIGVDFNTIPEATYDTTSDLNGDQELDDQVTIPNPLIGDYLAQIVGEPGAGGGSYTLAIKINGNEDTPLANNVLAPGPAEIDTTFYTVTEYLRGDPNRDGSKSVSDVIFLVNYLFKGEDSPDPLFLGDVNCCMESIGEDCEEAKVNISDVVYLINYLFKEGTAPCS